MDDFTAFLGARYDEAEANSRDALAQWPDTHFTIDPGSLVIVDFHRNRDPAHRLADIALKRAILALHHPELIEVINADQDERSGWFCAECGEDWECPTVRQLGTEFSAHADYRPAWAPEA